MIKPSQNQIAAMTSYYGTIEAARIEWKRVAKISNHVKPAIAEDGRIVSLCQKGYRECYSFSVARDYTIAHYSKGDHFCTMTEWCGRSFEDFDGGMNGRGYSRVVENFDMGDRGTKTTYYYVK